MEVRTYLNQGTLTPKVSSFWLKFVALAYPFASHHQPNILVYVNYHMSLLESRGTRHEYNF